MTGLVFIETIEDANHFKESVYQKDTRFNSVDIVSLNPNIHAYLKNNNILCLSSSDILSNNYYDIILEKCKILEGIIISDFERDGNNYPDYYLNTILYYLILIWRHFLWNIELVFQALKKKKYQFISAYMHEEVKTNSQWIEDDQLYLGGIVKKYADHRKYEFVPLKCGQIKLSRSNGLRGTILKKVKDYFVCTSYSLIISILLKGRTVLVSNTAYNMDKLCIDLKKYNKRIVFVSQGKYLSTQERLVAILRLLLNKSGIKCFRLDRPIDLDIPGTVFLNSSFEIEISQKLIIKNLTTALNDNADKVSHRNIFFGDYLQQKLNDDFVSPLTELELRSSGIQNLLEKLKPLAVLSQMNLGSHGALGYYASKIGISSFLISHGSHILHKTIHEKREHEIIAKNILYGNYSHLAVQSPFAKKMVLARQNKDDNIVKIKPTLWGGEVHHRIKNDEKFTIVHAGTPKFRHQRRLIYETSDEYVRALADICDCVRSSERIHLIIKTRPLDYELTVESLATLLSPLPNNVVIETSRTFHDVLAETDLLISFSSTTLEEALVNDVPVLLYGGHGRYAHIPVEPFSENNNIFKPVTFVNCKADLVEYFNVISLEYKKFRNAEFDFHEYKHKEVETVDIVKYISNNMTE
jgi:hypothetical protein